MRAMSSTHRSGAQLKPIQCFVIRVYRRDTDAVAGVLEDVRSSRCAPFKSAADLWQLISGRRRMPARPRAVPILPSHRPHPGPRPDGTDAG
jgi:hypothetical protein